MKHIMRVVLPLVIMLLCVSSVFASVGYAYPDRTRELAEERTVEWYVRMTYPYKRGAAAKGHYDLQLVGSYTFDGISYTNPVFSYGEQNGVAYLDIFNASKSKAYYNWCAPFKAYICNRTASSTDSQYRACLKLIAGNVSKKSRRAIPIKNASGRRVGTVYRYKVTSSFAHYDEKRNCFTAVALWVNALGDSHFARFAASHTNKDYTAYAMIHDYPSTWTRVATYK